MPLGGVLGSGHKPGVLMYRLTSDPVVAQLALPLRSGGFGLRLTTPLEADTTFLAAAGAADVAMRPAPPPFRPFNPTSPHCAALIARWAALHDVAPGLWSPELRALAAPLLAPVLLHAQQEYGRHVADRRFANLLASALPSLAGTRFRARLHSCACPPPSHHPVRLRLRVIRSPQPGPAGWAGERPRPLV
jgi:hypothetical protein